MNFEMDDLMQMRISEQRKEMAFELLKEMIKIGHDTQLSTYNIDCLVANAIYMTDEFLKKIDE